MRPARPFSSLLALALPLAILAGCGDDPAGPDETECTADRLAHLADSLGGSGDITTTMALLMASDAMRAGAALQQIDVTLDGSTSAWTGIATRMSLSEQACAQLLDGLPGDVPDLATFCAPSQFTLAWRGERPEATSLLSFAGDTGTVSFDLGSGEFDGELGGFGFSMLRELDEDVLWFADSGSARSVVQSSGGPCPRQVSRRGFEIEMECTLERYRVSLAARYHGLTFGELSPLDPEAPEEPGSTLPPRRATIATQSLGGMHLHIVRYPDMPSMRRQGMAASSPEPAAIRAARMYLARQAP